MKFNSSIATLFIAGLAYVQGAKNCETKSTFKACAKRNGCYWDLGSQTCHEEAKCSKWDGAPGLCGENNCFYDMYNDECLAPCDFYHYQKGACSKLGHCSYDLPSKECRPKNCGQHNEDFNACISDGCVFDVHTADCNPKVPCDFFDGEETGCNANNCMWIPGVDQCEEPCSYNHRNAKKCNKASVNCEYDRRTKECSKVLCGLYSENLYDCRQAGCWMNGETAECHDKVECSDAQDPFKCEEAGCTWGGNKGCVAPCDYFNGNKKLCKRAKYCEYDKMSKYCGYA